MDGLAPTRLGWARILAIAISDCVVGFAVFFAAVVATQGAAEMEPGAAAILRTPQLGGSLVAIALILPPVAVAAVVWTGGPRLHVWIAALAYAACSWPLLGLQGIHLLAGVVPTLAAAGLYTLPRRRPKGNAVASASTA